MRFIFSRLISTIETYIHHCERTVLDLITEPLKIFVTVVEESSFSNAAKRLHLSQPNVSLHIRNLEHEFGMTLLHRTSKFVKLTAAGEILYRYAVQMLKDFEAAKEKINLLRDVVTGQFHIGASFTIGEYILPRLLTDFTTQYPQVQMELMIGNTKEIVQALRANKIHFGLVEGDVEANDLYREPFMQDELVLVAHPNHPLAFQTKLRPQHFQQQVWICREDGSGTRAFHDRTLEEYKLIPQRSFVFNSNQGVKEAVAAGLGIAILSRWVVHKELLSGELVILPLANQAWQRQFTYIHHDQTNMTMAEMRFKEVALQYGDTYKLGGDA